MNEAACYIKLYGYDNFSCVDHYNIVKKFCKNLKTIKWSKGSKLRDLIKIKG